MFVGVCLSVCLFVVSLLFVCHIFLLLCGEDYVLELTRSKFEALNKPFFDRTIDTVKRVLKDAKLQPADIDDVVLVGGSTRIPIVQDIDVENVCTNLLDSFDIPHLLRTWYVVNTLHVTNNHSLYCERQ